MALKQGDALLGGLFLELAGNSFTLAVIAAALTVALAVVVAYGAAAAADPGDGASARIAGLGYAIPGAVIAVGVLIPFARVDNALDAWMRATFGISTGLVAHRHDRGAGVRLPGSLPRPGAEHGRGGSRQDQPQSGRRGAHLSAAARAERCPRASAVDLGQRADRGHPGLRRRAEGAAGDPDPAGPSTSTPWRCGPTASPQTSVLPRPRPRRSPSLLSA